VGHQGQPRRAPRHRASGHDPGCDGEECSGPSGTAAMVLLAEGQRQSQILSARRREGSPRSCVRRVTARLPCCGPRQIRQAADDCAPRARPRRSQRFHRHPCRPAGPGLARLPVHADAAGDARGDANKVWVVPSELNDALKGLGSVAGRSASAAIPSAPLRATSPRRPRSTCSERSNGRTAKRKKPAAYRRRKAIQQAQELERPGRRGTSALGVRQHPRSPERPV
jgi:hypothetical protein